MLIGVPAEIKNNEFRVGMTPAGVRELVGSGQRIVVEQGAGQGIGLTDDLYRAAGAEIASNSATVWRDAELIVKVKEPQPAECRQLREGQVLFAYLHLAPDPEQARLLIESKATCIAYETVTDRHRALPLLAPMSEVAGRMAIQAAAHHLEKAQGGSGVLLGGVPGVEAAHVTILGGGVVGLNAARMAMGLGAQVTVVDRSLARLKTIDELYGPRLQTLYSTEEAVEQELRCADVVVGAVLIPGASAPKLVTRPMLGWMKPGSVLVDVAIDQGGCFETSRPTTHEEPTYVVDGVIHYCVANMPGGVARTSTFALTNATLPYVQRLAAAGFRKVLKEDQGLREGLNIHCGRVTHEAVAAALGLSYMPALEALESSGACAQT